MDQNAFWEGRLYRGATLPPGFRLVGNADPPEAYDHNLGGDGSRTATCPGCESLMMAGWDLNWKDSRLNVLFPWNLSRLTVFICPNCDLYQDPYWIVFGQETCVISSRDIVREPYMRISTPYSRRHCRLLRLCEIDYPTTEDRLHRLVTRSIPPGVYHQIGGVSIMRGAAPMKCCSCNDKMIFSGIVDSDEANYALIDHGKWETGLLFGDLGYLDVYTCGECAVVGVQLSIG